MNSPSHQFKGMKLHGAEKEVSKRLPRKFDKDNPDSR